MNNHIFANLDYQNVAACYFDWSMIAADFEAPLSNVLEILPTKMLKPLQIKTGVTQVTLMGMEYRQIDNLEPYNEFGVLIPVTPLEDEHHPGTPLYYIFQLPVTTQQACDGGVHYYGYPKVVAQISFDKQDENTRCMVNVSGQDWVSLEVGRLSTSAQRIDFCTYSVKEDKLLKTWIQIEGQSGKAQNPASVSYLLGNHPFGIELKNLKLSEAPVRSQYAPKLQSILYFPEEILSL